MRKPSLYIRMNLFDFVRDHVPIVTPTKISKPMSPLVPPSFAAGMHSSLFHFITRFEPLLTIVQQRWWCSRLEEGGQLKTQTPRKTKGSNSCTMIRAKRMRSLDYYQVQKKRDVDKQKSRAERETIFFTRARAFIRKQGRATEEPSQTPDETER